MSHSGHDLSQIYSIDVECVASGRGHLARTVAQIALVVRSKRMKAPVFSAGSRLRSCSLAAFITGLSNRLCGFVYPRDIISFVDVCSLPGFHGTSLAQLACASRGTYRILPDNAYRVRILLRLLIIAQSKPKRNATLMLSASSIEQAVNASPDVSNFNVAASRTRCYNQKVGL